MIYPDWIDLKEQLPVEEDYNNGKIFVDCSLASSAWESSFTIPDMEDLIDCEHCYWAVVPEDYSGESIATYQECKVTGEDDDPWRDPTCTSRDWVPNISDWSYW